MRALIHKHAEKLRFAIVGGCNTFIDFAILFGLVALGFPTIPSNIVSTSIALVFSYFANKKFTFKSGEKSTTKQVALFLTITLIGLWIIQPVIIEIVRMLLSHSHLNSYLTLLIGKLLATVATLIWNYLLYRKFVFSTR